VIWLWLALCGVTCGHERWAAKIAVPNGEPVDATVAALAALPRPAGITAKTPRLPVEEAVYRVHATLRQVIKEADHDLHLVLADGGKTVVAEIPDPDTCVLACSAKSAGAWRKARAAVATLVGQRVVVTGALFFDVTAHATGHPPNAVELHPVLSIRGE
jgi:hypothetical protein